jgi:hypothetical protein
MDIIRGQVYRCTSQALSVVVWLVIVLSLMTAWMLIASNHTRRRHGSKKHWCWKPAFAALWKTPS